MTRTRLLGCAAALAFGLLATISFADDGSDDADAAPVAKTAHPHKAGKHAAKTADVATDANAGKTSPARDPLPAPPSACTGDGWMISPDDGRCVKLLATPVVGPGR